MQQVGKGNSDEPNDLDAYYDDNEMPEEALQIGGRKGELVDAALLREQVVEHVARRYYANGAAQECGEGTKRFDVIGHYISISAEKFPKCKVIKVVQQDGRTDDCHHEKGSTEVEPAVDGKVPTGDVEETMEIKHSTDPLPNPLP